MQGFFFVKRTKTDHATEGSVILIFFYPKPPKGGLNSANLIAYSINNIFTRVSAAGLFLWAVIQEEKADPPEGGKVSINRSYTLVL